MRQPMIAAAAIVGVMAALVALLWAFQRSLIYFPFGVPPPPADIGLTDVAPVTWDTEDGLVLRGWFFGTRSRDGAPRTTVLVFNGNAGNRAHRAPLAEALGSHGLQVLLMDYRGYGGNPGSPSERGIAADARSARAYLASRSDVDLSRLVYFGESLGAAVAVGLAAEHPPAALVLRSPFTSLAAIGGHHYPFLPVRLLLRDRYDSLGRLPRIRAPLLVIAGDADRVVPVEQSRRLFEAAAEPKQLLVLPGADHNDPALLDGRELVDAVIGFLDAHP
ncbi:MAG: alpha/beta hydrolase [Acidimicrobiia bacterium]|nr:alpha/beta hydrolase [Acidimicrobiia bacterium]